MTPDRRTTASGEAIHRVVDAIDDHLDGEDDDRAGAPGPGDLAARVARLERAVGAVGQALAEVTGPTPGGSPGRSGRHPTTPAARGIRTVVQLGVAAGPGVGASTLVGSPLVGWVITLALTPLVAYVQSRLEDGFRLKPLLRDVGDPAAVATGPDPAP